MRHNEAFKDYKYNFDNYLTYMHGQVEELCKNYGKIDIFWFDFSYDDLRGEAWRATDLVRMMRSYLPDVIIDNRLEVSGEGFGSIATDSPSEYSGDFVSPEQIIPPAGILDDKCRPVVWEACITMNNHWGEILIKKLVECVSKGGNLLVNVGPDARGVIPKESMELLEGVGKWMKKNSASIYGCGTAGIDKPEYGRITRKGKKLYYHVNEPLVGFVPLTGVSADDVKKIRLLATGTELRIERNWITNNYSDIVFVSLGENPNLPDPIDTVIEVELK